MFLTEVCQFLRNWFDRDRLTGQYVVTDGVISSADGIALPLLTGQYYRIIGSVFNDGVHIYGTKQVTTQEENEDPVTTEVLIDPLVDEPAFTGAVWTMAVPPAFVELAAEIETWTNTNADAINSPYNSESFGGYSYTVKSSASGADGESGITWQGQFKSRLNPWRKI